MQSQVLEWVLGLGVHKPDFDICAKRFRGKCLQLGFNIDSFVVEIEIVTDSKRN